MRGRFDKMHGLGNDFVVVDARVQDFVASPALARAIADRHSGIGCDQLIVLDASATADVRMRIYNPDGGEAGACGNASRAVALLIGDARVETAGGTIAIARDGSGARVEMGEPRFDWQAIPLDYAMDTRALPLAWGALASPFAVNVGNPHVVFFVASLDDVALGELGPVIEHDAVFPDRVNVDVAQVTGAHAATMRVWERGAGLTRACGTGACAVAVAGIATRRLASPVRVTMPGGTLEIAWTPGEPIAMSGPAHHVFAGEIDWDTLVA